MNWTETTLQQRAAAALHYAKMSEAELVRSCQKLIGSEYVDQRKINRVITPKSEVKNSAFVPLIAEITGVRAVWLQWGVGDMLSTGTTTETASAKTEQLLELIDDLKEELLEQKTTAPASS
ncbi:MAG: hypothetical protein AAF438_13285 [Pseudomonadota bacterium]